MASQSLEINGTTYQSPAQPVVLVCVDGGDFAYLEHGIKAGIIPTIERFMQEGFQTIAQGTMPSFTCPNNMSITMGCPPAVHGISGNFYLDRETNEPVVMTGPGLLRVNSIMSEFSKVGKRVVSITAKDKLRQQLQKGMDLSNGSVSLSSQHADRCTLEENGIENMLEYVGQDLPDIYSAELSLFVLDAGIKLLEDRKPDLLYLSLTDFIQHAYTPGDPESDSFYKELDRRFAKLAELGATVALIADHGMNDKINDDGSPRVVFLQDILDEKFGEGATKVICPITDAFVGHHGALGGFVRVYGYNGVTPAQIVDVVKPLEGIERVLTREEVAQEFQLPLEPEGDVAVLADLYTVVGSRVADHDLSGLKGGHLRTHGSTHEADVPFIINRPLNAAYAARAASEKIQNYEVFDYVINGTVAATT